MPVIQRKKKKNFGFQNFVVLFLELLLFSRIYLEGSIPAIFRNSTFFFFLIVIALVISGIH